MLRFREERSFIYPLAVREEDERASPTMEAVAQTQAMACGRPRPVVVVAPIGPGCSDTLRAGTAFRSTSGSWVGLPHSFPSTAESFRG